MNLQKARVFATIVHFVSCVAQCTFLPCKTTVQYNESNISLLTTQCTLFFHSPYLHAPQNGFLTIQVLAGPPTRKGTPFVTHLESKQCFVNNPHKQDGHKSRFCIPCSCDGCIPFSRQSSISSSQLVPFESASDSPPPVELPHYLPDPSIRPGCNAHLLGPRRRLK